MKEIPLEERIIFALDVDSKDKALEWVEKLGSHIRFYKVGLQLFLAAWFPVIEEITKRGHKVMVDLKFFDIPETVQLAMRQLKDRGVTFATVHGNDPILKAAVKEKDGLKILAVTVLTSFGEEDMIAMFGQPVKIQDLVLSRARRALEIGCDGVVSSGMEAGGLRGQLGDNFLIVSPGIRPGKNTEIPMDDQRRIVTAGEAISNGADYVVVGRPISTAEKPLEIVAQIQSEIASALKTRN